jgi:hypothetical protein
VHAERGHGDGEQQHDGGEPVEQRAVDPRAEVDRHRQRRAAHALEQPVSRAGGDADDQARVAGEREAEDRDRGRVELRERTSPPPAHRDTRVAVERVEQRHEARAGTRT